MRPVNVKTTGAAAEAGGEDAEDRETSEEAEERERGREGERETSEEERERGRLGREEELARRRLGEGGRETSEDGGEVREKGEGEKGEGEGPFDGLTAGRLRVGKGPPSTGSLTEPFWAGTPANSGVAELLDEMAMPEADRVPSGLTSRSITMAVLRSGRKARKVAVLSART
jgi:hypothetical protein